MASFKLNIADPKEGKCYKTEIKDDQAAHFIGLNIGESVDGSKIGIDGFEFKVTGGSDYCGFPMRKGILGVRKRLTIEGGVGFKGESKGIKKRKTVCGHKINDKISAINLAVTKQGGKALHSLFGGEAGAKTPKEEEKAESKEEKKVEEKPKEAKPEAEKKPVKEEKKAEEKPEAAKEGKKNESKPGEKKE